MRRMIVILIAALVLMVPDRVEGRGWGVRGHWRQSHERQLAPVVFSGRRTATYRLADYPQYYGGFHARHLQNIGIPIGDIGIRGNSITVNPW